ncbi:predicted protein [Botrytis cinerea T4]|uniref:Uncharacterized protein n=1 Tax=Botryotinia fuckeliana (strain T4) TaxID=999810 RepID=G2YGP5_BOTF4|nr:predicted protein [Botrytis cinerea T4]
MRATLYFVYGSASFDQKKATSLIRSTVIDVNGAYSQRDFLLFSTVLSSKLLTLLKISQAYSYLNQSEKCACDFL